MKIRTAFLASVLLSLGVASCAPTLGKTIEAPQIPVVASKPEARARLGSYIAVTAVQDARTGQPATDSAVADYTEPYGGVTNIVETGLKNAFRDAGIAVVDTAPVSIKAEVRKWRAQVDTKSTSAISSEATLFVEVDDPTGKRIYSGTYNGTRSSQFPVVTRIDVQDSLGLAMANAIEQVISDPQLVELLNSF